MIQLVQPLQWREQSEHRPEALRLQLAELEQVKGGGDERERQHGEAEHADRDVEDRPGAAPRRGRGFRREPDEQREPEEPRRERPSEHPHRRRAKQALARRLQRHEEQGQHGQRRGDAEKGGESRDADHVRR